jgi:hypothetical protein
LQYAPEASSLFAYAQQARRPAATAADCTAVTAAADTAATAAASASAVKTVRGTSSAFNLIANTTMSHTEDLITTCDWRVTVQSNVNLHALFIYDSILVSSAAAAAAP